MITLTRLIEIKNIFDSNKDWIDIYSYDNVASIHLCYNLITENLFPEAYELTEYCIDKISIYCKEKKDKNFVVTITDKEIQNEISNIFFKTITFYITKYDRKTIGKASYVSVLTELSEVSEIRSTWDEDNKILDNVVINLSYYDGIYLFGDLLHEFKHAYKDYKKLLSGSKGIIVSKEKIQRMFDKYNKSHKDNPLTNQDFHLMYNFVDSEEADAYVSSVIGDIKKQKFKTHKEAFDWLYSNSDSWNMCVHLLKKAKNTLEKIEDDEYKQMNEYLAKLIDKNWSKFISKVYSYIDRNNVEVQNKISESFSHESAEHIIKREKRKRKFIKEIEN